MISVDEAWKRILEGVRPLSSEAVTLDLAPGRTLARDVIAKITVPAADISAMDGYAVRHGDLAKLPALLDILGEAPAGKPFAGKLSAGQCVRIFTGGVVPEGADTVVIQENTERLKGKVKILEAPAPGRNIRKAGMDISEGAVLVFAGKPLNERDLALIAGGNNPRVEVFRRPRVALLANGDELVAPGAELGPGAVVNSNTPALSALLQGSGAEIVMTEIIPDDPAAIGDALRKAAKSDLIITLGGASVGDYDYVLPAFKAAGGAMDFWKIAMKPGKPLMFGTLGNTAVLGLPGNPNSAYVTAFLFALPLIRAFQGQKAVKPRQVPARAGAEVPATQDREVFFLASLGYDEKTGGFTATAHPKQDSARMSTLQASGALIRRPPNSPPAKKGEVIQVLPLPGF